MTRSRDAFSLIELLIVITVIVLLAALILVGAGLARTAARWAQTGQRMEDLLTRLSQVGEASDSRVRFLQEQADLGGVFLVEYAPELRPRTPAVADPWLDYDQPHNRRSPLGREHWTFPGGVPTRGTPEDFGLQDANPRRSGELAVACGTAPDLATWRIDRDPERPWNDAWGRPLVVAYALYQHGPLDGATWTPSAAFTREWNHKLERYGFARSLTLCVGAAGPRGSVPDTIDATALDGVWGLIATTANRDRDGTSLWRVDYTTDPTVPVNATTHAPWTGVRKAKAEGRTCALAAPIELR